MGQPIEEDLNADDRSRSYPLLVRLAERVSKLNPNAGEIGDGMLASLVIDANRAMAEVAAEAQ